jgi:hypothetical protein
VYLLLYLHIVTMFIAVSVAAGSSILLLVGARRGDRQLVAGLSALPIDRIVPPLYMVGGLFGLGTGLAFGYNLVAPWMLIAYALFAVLTFLGIRYTGPLVGRVHVVASDQATDAQAFAQVIRRFQLDTMITLGGIALIVADMVFKPFA